MSSPPVVAVVRGRPARVTRAVTAIFMMLLTLLLALMVVVMATGRGSSPASTYAVPLTLFGLLWLLTAYFLHATNEYVGTSWLFGIEDAGLRLSDLRSPGGHVLVPWSEIRLVRPAQLGSVLGVRFTREGARRLTRRTPIGRWLAPRLLHGYPLGLTTLKVGDALAAVEARAPGLTGGRR